MIHKWVRWLSSGVAKSVVTVVLLVMLAACAAQAPVPQDKYYRLQAIPAFQPLSSPVLSGVLEIERFMADGLTAGRPIVYVDAADPNQLREYHYHFGRRPPPSCCAMNW